MSKKNICLGCKQELREGMICIDREEKDWEIFFFTCVACRTKGTISFDDYENLKDLDDWYMIDI